ncbi:MAG TPA: outer membrane beta-barrel protein [Steroidobacteraceae bacterium]|nr:outer membrane beta-barrel protein [Steroidobacteraceae bacterium]
MRKAMVLGVLGLAGTLASPAFADEFTGFRMAMNLSSDTLESDLFFNPVGSTEAMRNDRFGYGLSGGWALNKYLAFETGLRSGSEFNSAPFFNFWETPLGVDKVSSHTDVKALDASAVGSLWIGRKFSLFGRVGVFAWKAEQTMSIFVDADPDAIPPTPATKQTVSVDDNGFSLLYGAGIQTELDGALIRLEYQFMELDDLTAPGAFNLQNNKMNSLNFSIVWTL